MLVNKQENVMGLVDDLRRIAKSGFDGVPGESMSKNTIADLHAKLLGPWGITPVRPQCGKVTYPKNPAQVEAIVPAGLVDGITPEQCLYRYTVNQREGDVHFVLTDKQRWHAQRLWSAHLQLKVVQGNYEDAQAARAARMPCQGDWVDDGENL